LRLRGPVLLAVALTLAAGWLLPIPGAVAQAELSITVEGNHLVNQNHRTVLLHGVNTSGTEYACVSENSIFDGNEEANKSSIAAMRSWRFNAARVQLNESCWLGIQGVERSCSGRAYQRAVENYVGALIAAGMYVIIDMHYSSEGGPLPATGQVAMPDERYAPAFWRSVAHAFEDKPAVIFDLFNEPYPDQDTDSSSSWNCVLRGSAGGTCKGLDYRVAGMQQLLDSVRAVGARNVVMVGGPQYAGDLDHWLKYEPKDPLHELAASIHIYWDTPARPAHSPCYRSSCWNRVLSILSQRVPVVIGEFGEMDCGDTLYPELLDFADEHGISYLGWAWFVGSCADEPSLIANYSGTPTAYGVAYKRHLMSRDN